MKLTVHPRLFARPEDFALLDQRLNNHDPLSRSVRTAYEQAVAEFTQVRTDTGETGHNWHLIRMRNLQKRLLTVLIEYLRTGDEQLRGLVTEYLRLPAGWDFWSWIDWRANGACGVPGEIYDLSYGEMGLTLAAVYDWLYDELTDEEQELLTAMARRQTDAYLGAYAADAAWWATKEYSNWTAVTAGGAGMLALSMYEELDKSEEVLQRAEQAMEVFFGSLHDDGGWPEGVGYWVYGMRYGYLYLLSHEAATGRQHPLFASKGVRNTAVFPLLFCPQGQAVGFGDANGFQVMPFHYRVLERLGLAAHAAVLDEIGQRQECFGNASWPSEAFYGIIGPQPDTRSTEPSQLPANNLLGGIQWGYMSDAMPMPQTFISVRGGSADVPHGHADLMAFWFQAKGEQFLINATDGKYLDTTFSPSRYELYGCGPLSKNTVLLNGIGIRPDSTSDTRSFDHDGHFVIQIDTSDCFGGFGGTKAYGDTWLHYCCRSFVNLGAGRYLIIDRVRFSNEGQFEARFHTLMPMAIDDERNIARLSGEQATARLRFACGEPVVLRESTSAPVMPQRSADTILQVQSERLVPSITLAALVDIAECDDPLQMTADDGNLILTLGDFALCTIPLDANGDPFGS